MTNPASSFFYLLVFAFPVFFLTLRGWVNALLLIASALAVSLIYQNKSYKHSNFKHHQGYQFIWGFIAFAMPFFAIALGQLFRTEMILRDYDGPLRILIAFLVCYAIYQATSMSLSSRWLFEFSIPACIYVTLFVCLVQPYTAWGTTRLTTYFVDPLTFGSMCLALGTISLVSLDLFQKDSLLLRFYKLGAVAAGIYLSIRSGSRTGWFGFPVIIFFVFCLRFYSAWGFKKIAGLLLLTIACVVISYETIATVHDRVNAVTAELSSYQWQGENSDDSSVGVRISLLRMAWFYFQSNPLAGWGDTGFIHLVNAPEIATYANETTRLFASQAGFHNEIAANMVRSGIWGLLAVLSVLLIPLCIFSRYVASANIEQRGLAIIGIGYVSSTFVNGMTTEVFNLKYCTSFYAFLIAVLIGSILKLNQQSAATPQPITP